MKRLHNLHDDGIVPDSLALRLPPASAHLIKLVWFASHLVRTLLQCEPNLTLESSRVNCFLRSPLLMLWSTLAGLKTNPSDEVQQRPPRYNGEDTTPTSRREILGWYAYGIAAEVFAVCGVGMIESYPGQKLIECVLS